MLVEENKPLRSKSLVDNLLSSNSPQNPTAQPADPPLPLYREHSPLPAPILVQPVSMAAVIAWIVHSLPPWLSSSVLRNVHNF